MQKKKDICFETMWTLASNLITFTPPVCHYSDSKTVLKQEDTENRMTFVLFTRPYQIMSLKIVKTSLSPHIYFLRS